LADFQLPIIPFRRTWPRTYQHGQVFVRDHHESNLSSVAHYFALISRLNACKFCLYNTNVKVTEWSLACPTLDGAVCMQICSKCGQAYDGYHCGVCVAVAAVKRATYLYLLVGGAGLFGTVISVSRLYPTLEHTETISAFIILLFAAPIGLNLWYPKFARSTYVVAATLLITSAAVYFLNGALDKHPPTEVRATVTRKLADWGQGGANVYTMIVTWDQTQKEQSFSVSSEVFSAVEPGDSILMTIHPGAFSIPWHGGLRFSP